MASWLSLAEPCQFHSSQLVSSNPLLFLLFEWFRRIFLCHMHPSPPTPNKEHAGWEQSTDELSRGSLYWGWGQVNSSRNWYIHNYKLMTVQKMKFKWEPQIFYSCSLVLDSWRLSKWPSVQPKLCHFFLCSENQSRGVRSPQRKTCRVAGSLPCLHKAVS